MFIAMMLTAVMIAMAYLVWRLVRKLAPGEERDLGWLGYSEERVVGEKKTKSRGAPGA